jgi:MFS family permease
MFRNNSLLLQPNNFYKIFKSALKGTPDGRSRGEYWQKGSTGAKLVVLILMAFSIGINYIDRGSPSTAAPLLKMELLLLPAQLGMLLSAFFCSYTLLQIFFGWLVDRYNMVWIMAIGYLLWFRWKPRVNNSGQLANSTEPEIKEILTQRALWATSLGHFCGNYFWYLVLTWLPFYLVKERGFTMENIAYIGALAYGLTIISTVATGWFADQAIAVGSTPTRLRKTCTTAGLTFASVIVAVAIIPGSVASMLVLMVACISQGVFASSNWAITQTIVGPAAASKWSGLQNCFANMAGSKKSN